MPGFLSKAWVDAISAALSASDDHTLRDIELTLQQIVTDAPGGEVAYWLTFDRGAVTGNLGRSAEADVTFEMDHATAVALAGAELNHQAAFMQGMLKVTGNMGKLLQHQAALKVLAPVMSSIGSDR
jgi:putative sterol carrier protein